MQNFPYRKSPIIGRVYFESECSANVSLISCMTPKLLQDIEPQCANTAIKLAGKFSKKNFTYLNANKNMWYPQKKKLSFQEVDIKKANKQNQQTKNFIFFLFSFGTNVVNVRDFQWVEWSIPTSQHNIFYETTKLSTSTSTQKKKNVSFVC